MAAGRHAVADHGVFVHLRQAAGLANTTTLSNVGQDGDGILFGQARPKQGRSFAFGEANLTSGAIEHTSLLVGSVTITDAQVAGAAFAILRAFLVLTTKMSQVFHGEPSVVGATIERTNTGSMVIGS